MRGAGWFHSRPQSQSAKLRLNNVSNIRINPEGPGLLGGLSRGEFLSKFCSPPATLNCPSASVVWLAGPYLGSLRVGHLIQNHVRAFPVHQHLELQKKKNKKASR